MHLSILIYCRDRTGIISEVTGYLHGAGGNVVYLDQYVDQKDQIFFMRLEADFGKGFELDPFVADFQAQLATPFEMEWAYHTKDYLPKMAIFVSKYRHCLYDLLSRYRSGELKAEIPFVLSNHSDLGEIADQFDIPFYHVPVKKGEKEKAEKRQLELLKAYKVDFIVLARYMQIVTERLIDVYPNKIINIHHSFLPAFAGAKPYHAAFERGVKIIGATSHYVTKELDAGPIIEQDVVTVSHAHNISDYIARGRDLEKVVLARAVKLHLERKTMVYNNKTVIFT